MFNFFKWLLMLKICKREPEFARYLEFHGAKVRKNFDIGKQNRKYFSTLTFLYKTRGLPVVGTRRLDGASAVSPYPRPCVPVIILS